VIDVSSFIVGPLQENAYLLVDRVSGEAVFVDPGAEGERLVAAVEAANARLTEIWLTHAHFDHVGGVAALCRAWPEAAVRLHPADEPLYLRAAQSAATWGLTVEEPPALGAPLAEGDVLKVGGHEFAVMHTPGHAPGHVTIHGQGIALVGDCLFLDSVGRTDLPLSDPSQLAASLARIAALPDETRVLSGHGPATTIGRERRQNPFLNGGARVVGS
jgi:glyoxylase-like metal-dependent hydrolase (beta-lactamase superfamily II)